MYNLKPLVNNPTLYGDFQKYIEELIAKEQKNFEQDTTGDLSKYKERIVTLRKLQQLKEVVNAKTN